MSALSALKTHNDIETEKDSVGGGFSPLDSGLYDLKVITAYLKKSQGGALALELAAVTPDGKNLRQSLWMASGDAKGNKNYFEDKNGKKQYLPGFNHANAIALLTVGKEIGELETEEKVINIYSYDAQADVPTKVEMFTELLDQEFTAGVIQQIVDKNVKTDSGAYVPSGETRTENEIDKIFRSRDGLTVAEIRAEASEANFRDAWEKKWTGETKNKAKGVAGNAGTPGKPGAAPVAAAPTKSLFT